MQHKTYATEQRSREVLWKNGVSIVDSSAQPLVYANQGRWVADCQCGGAEIVAPDSPMVCAECGRRYHLTWPAGWDRAERLLDARPDVNTRNWRSDRESVDDLEAENTLYGVEAP